jgi:hypothetical protein
MEMPHMHRPIPRRTFEITPASTDSSHPPSPAPEPSNPDLLSSPKLDMTPSSRTRSILNLTSSTLFGIYSPVSDGEREELSTPWGTGAQTPIHRRSIDDYRPQAPAPSLDTKAVKTRPKLQRKGFRGYVIPLVIQTILLFGFGVGYGSLVTHLHQTRRITPIPLPDVERTSLYYHLCWGFLGIVLGNALPLVDSLWEKSISPAVSTNQTPQISRRATGTSTSTERDSPASSSLDSGTGPLWYSTVRSMGAFVGIAFAVVSYSTDGSVFLLQSLTLLATDTLAIHLASRLDSGTRQPGALVCHRQILTWVCIFSFGGHSRHHGAAAGRPELCARAGDPSVNGIGAVWGLRMVGEHFILHKHLFRSHRKAASIVSTLGLISKPFKTISI